MDKTTEAGEYTINLSSNSELQFLITHDGEIGRACSEHERDSKYVQKFGWNARTEGTRRNS